jgi:hypothetical protein
MKRKNKRQEVVGAEKEEDGKRWEKSGRRKGEEVKQRRR